MIWYEAICDQCGTSKKLGRASAGDLLDFMYSHTHFGLPSRNFYIEKTEDRVGQYEEMDREIVEYHRRERSKDGS